MINCNFVPGCCTEYLVSVLPFVRMKLKSLLLDFHVVAIENYYVCNIKAGNRYWILLYPIWSHKFFFPYVWSAGFWCFLIARRSIPVVGFIITVSRIHFSSCFLSSIMKWWILLIACAQYGCCCWRGLCVTTVFSNNKVLQAVWWGKKRSWMEKVGRKAGEKARRKAWADRCPEKDKVEWS